MRNRENSKWKNSYLRLSYRQLRCSRLFLNSFQINAKSCRTYDTYDRYINYYFRAKIIALIDSKIFHSLNEFYKFVIFISDGMLKKFLIISYFKIIRKR